jgi:hypothetical protein
MTKRVTLVSLRGVYGADWAEWGEQPVDLMVRRLRERAVKQKAAAEAVLNADPADFRVESYTGVAVQRNRNVLQEGRKA